MTAAAASLFLATLDARQQQREHTHVAATSAARELEDDGGLVAYAERLARRRNPTWRASYAHLQPIADRCEAAERAMRGQGDPVFSVMHACVQSGKTSLLQAFVDRTLRRNPRARIGYGSFNADRAEGKMWTCRELAHGEGIHLHPTFNTKREWRTVEGGVVRAGGIQDGSWTGEGFDVLILDDLYSGPSEADSAAHRAHVERAFDDVIWTRRQKHTSILVCMARWNPSDLSGVLIRRGWPYVCLPAIRTERGEEVALWPEVMPLSELRATRDGRPEGPGQPAMLPVPRRTWASLYQGQPIAEGAHVFEPGFLRTYDRLPDGLWWEAIGIDVAYGAKARNDRSSQVTFRAYAHRPRDLFLIDAWIGHELLELFACRIAAHQIRRAGGPLLVLPRTARAIEQTDGTPAWMPWAKQLVPHARSRRTLAWWYASGTESGAVGMLRVYGAQVHVETAGIDKLARAQGGYVDPSIGGYAPAWNEGRVYWPANESEHARAIRIQHEDFTGAPTDDDDGVDAAVAGHDAIQVQELLRLQATREQEQRAKMAASIGRKPPTDGLGPVRAWY